LTRPVVWSDAAFSDLNKGIAYIAERNPAAARRVLTEIEEAASALGEAAIGRPGRVTGTYEKVVVGRPYIIAYALDPQPNGIERVVILHVIHTARNWPHGEWPE
jgi:plasmid stabilization system protein ParE